MRLQLSPQLRIRIFLVLLAGIAVILAYVTRFRNPANEASPVVLEPSPSPISQAEVATKEYSQAQIAKLIYAPLTLGESDTLTEDVAGLAALHVGGVVLFGTKVTVEEVNAFAAELEQFPEWQPEILVDHEGGVVQRLSGTGFTRLLSWQAVCALPQVERVAVLESSLQELKDVGVTMVLAPMVDVGTKNPVLGTRLCSSDPDVVVAAASDYIEVARAVGIEPVLKHYPGIGSAELDTHKELPVIDPSLEEIAVFSQLLEKFPDLTVMVGHVAIAGRDPSTPCSLSKPCIAALTESYPQVRILSDALEMEGAKQERTLSETAKLALEAGNDYLLFGNPVTMEELEAVISEVTGLLQ
ncbi:MAG: hypothetical protein O2840_03865 [bacterium]|nr:hypothetical protein [bacterium]